MSAVCKHADVRHADGGHRGEVAGRSGSPPVVDLEAVRVRLLAEDIARELVVHRGAVTHLAETVGDVDAWRHGARRAGRLLGVPVRTGVAIDGSKVWVVDESR